MPERIQRRRTAGWRMPEGAIYVGRPTAFGNPWATSNGCTTGPGCGPGIYGPHAADIFLDWLAAKPSFPADEGPGIPLNVSLSYLTLVARRDVIIAGLSELRGRDMACWCPLDQPCHADVLLELANG